MASISRLRQQNRELEKIYTIAEALNRPVNLDEALRLALTQVTELFDLQTGWIFLIDEQTGEPALAASLNLPRGLLSSPDRMQGLCYCLEKFLDNAGVEGGNINIIRCSRLKGLIDEGDQEGTGGLRSHASIPIYAHDRKIGLMNVAGAEWRGLDEDDLRLLHTIGEILGIAVARARLFEERAELGALEERSRIAREIHDTLAQELVGIALRLEGAEGLIESIDGGLSPSETRAIGKIIRDALDQTRRSLQEARRSVLDLRAASFSQSSLPEALEALPLEQPEGSPPLTVDVTGNEYPLPPRIESGIYRIARECLTNATRHANAGSVQITLRYAPDSIFLMIEDDGDGFEADAIPEDRYGLVGLNERVRLMGGELDIESSSGVGTRVEVRLPRTTLPG